MMRKPAILSLGLLLALPLALTACGGSSDQAASDDTATEAEGADAAPSLVDAIAATGNHATLGKALDAAGLKETLTGAGPFTLLAPTDAAFAALPAGKLDAMMAEQGTSELTSMLMHLILAEDMDSAAITAAIDAGGGKAELATVGGGPVTASKDGDALILRDGTGNSARIEGAGVDAANGTVLVIDKLLMPG